MIDVSRVSQNSKFWQKVKRIIRRETMDEFGRNVLTAVASTIDATITVASPNDLNRFTDATTYIKGINIMTQTNVALNADNVLGQPDVIIWKNEHFQVIGTYPYSGNGFNRAIATLYDYQASVGG